MRSSELKNYVSSIGAAIAIFQKAQRLLLEDKEVLRMVREELFENKMFFMKSQLVLTFLISHNDAEILKMFNIGLISAYEEMIGIVTLATKSEEVNMVEINEGLVAFSAKLESLLVQAATITNKLPKMIRRHYGS